VLSDRHENSVQIFPETALVAADPQATDAGDESL
jgi:hypothetical protein